MTLRRVRLARARRDLLLADPTTQTVTAVACRWGFAHPGRFAAGYRTAYGAPQPHPAPLVTDLHHDHDHRSAVASGEHGQKQDAEQGNGREIHLRGVGGDRGGQLPASSDSRYGRGVPARLRRMRYRPVPDKFAVQAAGTARFRFAQGPAYDL
ncbi:helix-turn-helix domain-containing protein, partial [Streptomyces sp. CRN 30]|uniref:helix-turn-helix domain-containing protein n=1 Tax=Streptomyces sp. CRN 30 TaxID=3075613 RepID=UPI002A7F1ED0